MRIARGRLFAMFSFDVGYEIDLRAVRGAHPAGAPNGSRKDSGPPRVQFPSPAVSLVVGPRPVVVDGRTTTAEVTLRAHEFGAATVLFAIPFDDVECEGLPSLTATLTAGATLERIARTVLAETLPGLAAAIVRPALDGHQLVEDYYVVQVSRFDPDTDAPALLGTHRDLLARIVHCEPHPLSPSETDEVLRTAVTYRPRDLVVTDWNVALVFDEE